MYKRFCDRCGVEIKQRLYCEIKCNMMGKAMPFNSDLCVNCAKDFCEFLKIPVPWERH